tara:strand:- start:81 stop:461 length:381 start_codon:yes stop_codon:yes gene_type:complete
LNHTGNTSLPVAKEKRHVSVTACIHIEGAPLTKHTATRPRLGIARYDVSTHGVSAEKLKPRVSHVACDILVQEVAEISGESQFHCTWVTPLPQYGNVDMATSFSIGAVPYTSQYFAEPCLPWVLVA